MSTELRLGLTTVAFCVWMAMADCAWSQTNDLPRHAVIGLQVAPLDLNKPEDPVKNPPTIKSVIPDGAGEMAGIQVGDVLLAVDGAIVRSSTDFAKRSSLEAASFRN